jgi:molybdate transport system substrate-binding protein
MVRYPHFLRALKRTLCCALLLATSACGRAEVTTIAVAANFAVPIERLKQDFQMRTGHEITVALGATGQLYAQVANGAPFDVLLAADSARPTLLAAAGLAEPTTQFTYAQGELVLWGGAGEPLAATGLARLRAGDFRRLAIANPALAPYGLAAQQTLEALGLWQALQPKLVRAGNVSQTLSLIATGNAELGFVALSQVIEQPAQQYLKIAGELHAPINQDAILLRHGAHNAAAIAFLDYLRSPAALAQIRAAGYGVTEIH